MKKGRDVKFVIYQVLYIFVVCVITLKGADISLEEVLDAKQVVKKTYADSLKKYIDSILALGLIPSISIDTNMKYTADDMERIMAELNQLKKDMPPPIVQQEQMRIKTETTAPKIEETKQMKKSTVQGVELTQYSQSSLKNPYSETLTITADGRTLASIPPQGTAKILLGGESSVTFRVGDATDTKPTKQKQAPKIDIQKVGPGGGDASLRSVQNSIGYRVTIVSNNPGDLDVKISGPVSTKQVSPTVFDVTLTLLGSETAFEAWSKNKESPYKASFTVSVKDKYNPKLFISQIGVFTFGKW
jgi:hypothetical protein